MVINTNISAQMGAVQLADSSKKLASSLARLSSGSKIISPADDAAGLAVSMKFEAQIRRSEAASNNLSNALSFAQTQDGYLQKVSDALSRMGELAVLAQDQTKTDSDRGLYNQEFQSLTTFVNDVASKEFNGVSLFSSSALNVATDGEGGSLGMSGISASYVAAGVSSTTTSTVGYATSTALSTFSSTLASGTGQLQSFFGGGNQTFNSSSTIGDLVNFINSTNGNASASYNASTGLLSFTVANGSEIDDPQGFLQQMGFTPSNIGFGDFYGNSSSPIGPATYSVTLSHSVTTTTTTSSMDISTVSGTASALTQVKSALSQVATDRANIGANIERIQYQVDQLSTLKNNLSAANSRMVDVDVAAESTRYARAQILVQSGTAMLAQANTLPSTALRLLG